VKNSEIIPSFKTTTPVSALGLHTPIQETIGAGINLSSGGAPAQFDWDYDGHARGDLWDIGAFDSNVTVATRSAVRTRVTVFESRRSLSHPLQREAFEDFAKELKKLAPERILGRENGSAVHQKISRQIFCCQKVPAQFIPLPGSAACVFYVWR
jgi:hypothetical protein